MKPTNTALLAQNGSKVLNGSWKWPDVDWNRQHTSSSTYRNFSSWMCNRVPSFNSGDWAVMRKLTRGLKPTWIRSTEMKTTKSVPVGETSWLDLPTDLVWPERDLHTTTDFFSLNDDVRQIISLWLHAFYKQAHLVLHAYMLIQDGPLEVWPLRSSEREWRLLSARITAVVCPGEASLNSEWPCAGSTHCWSFLLNWSAVRTLS